MAWIEMTLVGILVGGSLVLCLFRILRMAGLLGATKAQACGGCPKGCGCAPAPLCPAPLCPAPLPPSRLIRDAGRPSRG